MTQYRPYPLLRLAIVICAVVAACGGVPEGSPGSQLSTPVLGPDAIGAVDIGQPPGAAIDEMTSLFGEPDVDSLWIEADSPLYGECPGVTLRAVGWGSLYLFFTADEPVTPDNENVASRLYTYSYGYDFSRNEGATDPRGLDLMTEMGIGLGSTRAELRAAHGSLLTEGYNESTDTWTWSIDGSSESHLAGLFSGSDEVATVVLIERIPGCGTARLPG